MKNNKKGFTLVELLAVIVILGVLLLIAVPAVNNIIESSRERSFKSAVNLSIENVETMASIQKQDGGLFSTGKTSCYVLVSEIDLERGNTTGYTGYITVGSDAKGTANVSDGTRSATGKMNSLTIGEATNISAPTSSDTEKCTWFK